MTVIIPNAKILVRWNGALQSRLRHAPLEVFLRRRGLKWAVGGDARITENLSCATIHWVKAAIARNGETCISGRAAIGQIACAVSAALALLIEEPTYWRTAALVATARVLEGRIGLSAAAHVAAGAARDYYRAVSSGRQDAEVLRIGRMVYDAVAGSDESMAAEALALIAERLRSTATATLPVAMPNAAAV